MIINHHYELQPFFDSLKKTDKIGFDIETSGLDFIDDNILSLQFLVNDDIFVFTNPEMFNYIISLVEDKLLIGHNIKFDMKFVFSKFGILLKNVYDTMIANAILNAGINGFNYTSLNSLVERYFGISLEKEIRKEFENASELTDEMIEYAGNDVKYLIDIYNIQKKEISDNKLNRILDMEMKLLPVVVSMEVEGINLDIDKWLSISEEKRELATKLENKLKNILLSRALSSLSYNNLFELMEKLSIPVTRKRDRELYESIRPGDKNFIEILSSKLNIGSTKQLKTLLNIYGIGVDSTSSKALSDYELKHKLTEDQKELFETISKYREASKRATAFGKKYIEKYVKSDGKIHAEFNQLGTATGRFSSSNPNLQQIPHTMDYRSCFIASPGKKLITADYSQMELRIMAAVSNEHKMINAYKNGKDLHRLTSSLIFNKPEEEIEKEERSVGKMINFAVLYGAGAYRISLALDISRNEAEEILNRFHSGYNKMYNFIEEARKIILNKGYSVTVYGRKRFFEKPDVYTDYKEKNRIEQSIMREGVNHIIQGTGADIMKDAMVKMFYQNPFGHNKFKILLQVHDEVVVEVDEDIAEEAKEFIKSTMEKAECVALGNKLPCEVDAKIADTWVK